MKTKVLLLGIVATTLLTATTVSAQTPTTSSDKFCRRPKNAPRKERHLNCEDGLGRRQGVWKSYSYYGYLLNEVSYKDNKINGAVTVYYSVTGKVRERSSFFDGKRDGDYATFFYSGQPAAEGEFDYGKRIGEWTFYYNSTGEVRMNGKYVHGKRQGDWKFYNNKGALTKTVEYNKGEVVKTTLPTLPAVADGAEN